MLQHIQKTYLTEVLQQGVTMKEATELTPGGPLEPWRRPNKKVHALTDAAKGTSPCTSDTCWAVSITRQVNRELDLVITKATDVARHLALWANSRHTAHASVVGPSIGERREAHEGYRVPGEPYSWHAWRQRPRAGCINYE